MIDKLKEAADKWFGDNGDRDQEEQFLAGWLYEFYDLDASVNLTSDVNFLAGKAARMRYDKESKTE